MPIDEIQESKIRDLLSVVVIYFQLGKTAQIEMSETVLKEQKQRCIECVEELMMIMNKPTINGKVVEACITPQYHKFGKIILEKLGYETEGSFEFLKSCVCDL